SKAITFGSGQLRRACNISRSCKPSGCEAFWISTATCMKRPLFPNRPAHYSSAALPRRNIRLRQTSKGVSLREPCAVKLMESDTRLLGHATRQVKSPIGRPEACEFLVLHSYPSWSRLDHSTWAREEPIGLLREPS